MSRLYNLFTNLLAILLATGIGPAAAIVALMIGTPLSIAAAILYVIATLIVLARASGAWDEQR